MVMTIHKLTAGDGYTYLTRQVAGGDVSRAPGQDAAGYYTANGNPPGSWIGRGAPLLGLAGQQVTEEQMRALFGHGQHPNSEAMIQAHLAASARPGMSAAELARSRREAIRAATLGRPFPSYEPLEKFDVRVRRRLAIITQETGREPTEAEVKKVHREEARRQRAAVAGFDAVFAPVKSAVLLWALDERPWVRDAVRQAHEDAKNAALQLLEEHAAFTRTGTGGIAQIRTKGLIAAAFDHYDSRDGDPEPAHPRGHLQQGPGRRRQVAGPRRPRPVPDHGRCVGVLQHRVRDRAHCPAGSHVHSRDPTPGATASRCARSAKFRSE